MERVRASDLRAGMRILVSGFSSRADRVELEQRVLSDWSLNCYVKAGVPEPVTIKRLTPVKTGVKVSTEEGRVFTLTPAHKVQVI